MNDDIMAAAARWHSEQAGDGMDWQAFTVWLEADPRHREAFDSIELLDDHIGRHRAAVRSLLTGEPRRAVGAPKARRRAAWWGSAAVAVAAAVAVVTLGRPVPPAGPLRYQAGPSVAAVGFAAGMRIELAPRSTLLADRGATRNFRLNGRALFNVRHDPDRPLTIVAGGYRIVDVGTRFDVATGNGLLRVAVAEGRVAVTPPGAGAAVEVGAGQVLTGDAAGHATTASVIPAAVGNWRSGPLIYEDVPLGIVAADVSRVAGRTVSIDAAVRQRSFSGVLSPADSDGMIHTLAALAGLKTRTNGDTISLVDGTRP